MKVVLVLMILVLIYFMAQNKLSGSYEQGYADGIKNALKNNPPSQELELVCAGLWVGEQNKKYWSKENKK